MWLFKTRWFARFARQENIPDASLRDAVSRAMRGLIDAELGGHILKQRVARKGQGRSGGYRVLLAFRAGERAIFLYGFSKNERDNINADELATLKGIADDWFKADSATIERELSRGSLVEVAHET